MHSCLLLGMLGFTPSSRLMTSRFAPGFKLSHLCPCGLWGIDGDMADGERDGDSHCISWPPGPANQAAGIPSS